MWRARNLVVVLLVVATGACTTTGSVMQKIRPRAAFDLDCDEREVEVVLIDGSETDGT
jgi:hypothetical protein